MSCATNVLTQLGSDALNQAAGAMNPAVWTTPIEVAHALVLNGTSASGGGGATLPSGEAKYIGVVVPADQYAEIQWEYVGARAEFFDLTFRRDPSVVAAFFMASFTHASTSAFLMDNNGAWSSNFVLSSALATGDKIRVVMLGLQVCVFRDTGAGYVLEHSDTLPALLPTGGTTAGQTGFDLSGSGLVNNFATGSVSGSPCALRQIVNGGFQDASGNPLALGSLTFRLQKDASNTCSSAQTVAGRVVTVPLDANGNVAGVVSLAPTDVMTPADSFAGSYTVIAYTASGQPVWQNPKFLLPAGSTPFSLS